MNLREKTLQLASVYVGAAEVGTNAGRLVERWQGDGKIRKGDPWCAAYVNGIAHDAADILGVVSPLESVPLQGYVQSYFEHFQRLGYIVSPEAALPGDLFVLWYPHLRRYGHVGFVGPDGVDVRAKRYATVEGNTNRDGSREGDGVYAKRRILGRHVQFIRWTRYVQARARAA